MTRIRETFKSSEIAHVWTTQTYSVGRVSGGGNMSFNGDCFFSYGTCIAQIISTPDGKKVYLVSADNFSSTTGGHISAVLRAIPSNADVFYISARRGSGQLAYNPDIIGAQLLKEYHKKANDLTDQANRAREKRGYLMQEVARTQRAINRIISLWNLDNTPFSLDSIRELEDSAETLTRQALENRDKKARAKQAKQAEKLAADMEKWRNGETVRASLYGASVALRIAPDNPDVIETSHGARITVITAKKLFPFAMARRADGWKRNGETFKLDHYSLDAIDADGIRAGCHFIAWNEIERMAKVLGLA